MFILYHQDILVNGSLGDIMKIKNLNVKQFLFQFVKVIFNTL